MFQLRSDSGRNRSTNFVTNETDFLHRYRVKPRLKQRRVRLNREHSVRRVAKRGLHVDEIVVNLNERCGAFVYSYPFTQTHVVRDDVPFRGNTGGSREIRFDRGEFGISKAVGGSKGRIFSYCSFMNPMTMRRHTG